MATQNINNNSLVEDCQINIEANMVENVEHFETDNKVNNNNENGDVELTGGITTNNVNRQFLYCENVHYLVVHVEVCELQVSHIIPVLVYPVISYIYLQVCDTCVGMIPSDISEHCIERKQDDELCKWIKFL